MIKKRKTLGLLTVILMLISMTVSVLAVSVNNTSQIIGDGNAIVFIDVPSSHWAKDQIEYFAKEGIVDGYTDGSFKPEAGVTRAEFCKLLVSTFKQPLQTPNTPTFTDKDANDRSYAEWKFRDGSSISPNLVAYISIACKKCAY